MADDWGNEPLKTAPVAAAAPAATAPAATPQAATWGAEPLKVGTAPVASAATPTMTIHPTGKAPVETTPQTGDVPSQQPQPTGNFFASAHGPPPALAPIVQAAAAKYGVPLAVANWVGAHESNWDPSAVGQQTSTGTAKGAWQFKDGTAKEMGLADPHDFATSTDAAMRYLRKLADKNGGDWMKAVEAYGTFSTGMGAKRDAAARSGFEAFMGNTGASRGAAAGDKYAGWDTPDDPEADDPEWVPFRDPPGSSRGNVLPVYKSPEGNYSLAVPDFLRAPIRGAVEGGQEARGVRPVDDPKARGDIGMALGVGATPAAKMFATGAQKAATTFGEVAHGIVADETPPIPFAKTPQGRAETVVARRLNQDVAGGGAMVQPPIEHGPPPAPGAMPPLTLNTGPADNVVANLDRMRGKGGTLIDVGGPNVRGLAGDVARKPGAGQAVIRSTMEGRDTDAGVRAQADVQRYLTHGPSAYRTARDLLAQRSAEANPLYEKAFEGGSIAPLKAQFEKAMQEAMNAERNAQQDLQYAEAVQQDGSRTSRMMLDRLRENFRRTSDQRKMVEAKLAEVQADIESDRPGAVWSPRIQEFLDLPDVKRGLRRGFRIQRNDAIADGVPFNPTEYALSSDGEVLRVPNMRTLNVAKKGLDAIIADHRDEFGRLDEYGVSVDKVRRAFVAQLDSINPDYAAARRAWAGHSASLDALKWGKNTSKLPPEQVAEEFAAMSPGEQEFARLGVADTLLEKIGKTSFVGDESKALVNNQWTKDQLQPLFRTPEDFSRYIEAVAHERAMKDTQNRVLAGSQTAEREAETKGNDLAAAAHAAHGLGHVFSGAPLRALASAWRAYRNLGLKPDEAMTEAIAKTLTSADRVPEINQSGQFFYPPPIPTPPP